MEHFSVIIDNFITKNSVLDVAAVIDPPLNMAFCDWLFLILSFFNDFGVSSLIDNNKDTETT